MKSSYSGSRSFFESSVLWVKSRSRQAELQKAPSPVAESSLLEELNKDLPPGCREYPSGKQTLMGNPL